MEDSLNKVAWPVATERLCLRRLESEDLEATWRYRQLPEVTEWITAAPATFGEYREHFLSEGRIHRDVAVEIAGDDGNKVLIGTVMLKVHDGWGQEEILDQTRLVEAEIGWSFDPAYGGKGYATEAVRAVLELSFGALGLRRVVAESFAANDRSWKLMERVGMRRESYNLRNGLHRNGEWMDGVVYAMLADEWGELVTA